MDPNILAALIGAVVAAIVSVMGWFISFLLERKKDNETRRQELKISFLERQIEELYGPLWGLIEQSKKIFDELCQDLPRYPDGRLARDQFTNEQRLEYKFIKKHYFIPIHKQITEILQKKIHLVDKGEVPPSFVEFSAFSALFCSSQELVEDSQINRLDNIVMHAKWPKQFNEDIKSKLDQLQQEYREYMEGKQVKFHKQVPIRAATDKPRLLRRKKPLNKR